MKIRMNRYRHLLRFNEKSISINNLRSANKLLTVYSIVVTIGLAILAYKYMTKSNADTEQFRNYDAQVAQLTAERDYHQANSQMFSDSVADLIEVTTELNTDRDMLLADIELMQYELDEFYSRDELYDKYGFFTTDKRGERNDITYDQLRDLEEMVKDTSVPNADLILAIIYLESSGICTSYNTNSMASGYGQFLPSTAKSVWVKVLGNPEDSWDPDMVFDPDINLQLTVAYMDYLIKKHGSPYEALRQYSGSGTNTAHLNGYVATLDVYLRHTDSGSFANIEALYRQQQATGGK